MKKLLSVLLVLAMLCVSAAAMAETYTAEGQGNNGAVKVEVDVADGKIAAVRVVEHKETAGICDAAIDRIPAAIVEKQSLAVDTVSGATNTSKAILAAVEAAVTEAGLDAEAMKTASAEAVELQQLADDHCQTVVVGAGGAGITTAVELKRGGNDVVLLEKMAITGGSTTLAATYFVVTNTESQIAGGMETSVEDYVAHELAIDPALDAERLTTLMNKSQETLNWMNELGADLTRPLSYYQVGTTDGSSIGPALMRAFNNAIETYGIDLRLENEATEIIVEDGVVKGVKVVTPEGWYNLYIRVNTAYLSRVFKQEMGIGVTQYLARLRMEQSMRLLRETDMKIGEVAQLVGIEDAHYFSSMFKRYVGCSSVEYRKNQEKPE